MPSAFDGDKGVWTLCLVQAYALRRPMILSVTSYSALRWRTSVGGARRSRSLTPGGRPLLTGCDRFHPPLRVSVALTVGRNISATFSNLNENLGAYASQRKAEFIEVSWGPNCDALVWFALGWQFLLGSSPCLPANYREGL